MTLRIAKRKIRNLKKHFNFLSKCFAENGKERLLPGDSAFSSNSKNAKTNTFLTI